MEVFLTGGTGFIGRRLVERLLETGRSVTVLSRREFPKQASDHHLRFVTGDPTRPGRWQKSVARHPVVINLAGDPIRGRWDEARRAAILSSRIETTRNVVEALRPSGTVLVNASAIGYYGASGDEAVSETSAPGEGFLAEVVRAWESEALVASAKGARVILGRFGLVLGLGGGALEPMVRQVRSYAGGSIGSGRQWMAWIHIRDLIESILYLIGRESSSGAYNLTAPHPVTQGELVRELGRVLGRPVWVRIPRFALKLVLGEFASVLLEGQKALPIKLLQEGYTFRFERIQEALKDLLIQ